MQSAKSSSINSTFNKDKSQPIKILHVVGGMNRGGIETWLMHILRSIDRDRFQMDFLVHTSQPCAYDEEIRSLGSQIIFCPLNSSRPWQYRNNFKRILHKYGSYDLIHSHVHHFSGYVLLLSKQFGVPIRIAHSHNDTSAIEVEAKGYRRLYTYVTKFLLDRYATIGLGCSREAIVDLFGSNWENRESRQLLYYGIDIKPFHNCVDRIAIRKELGIPDRAFVLGHIGRFDSQKNHTFLLDIAAEIDRREPNFRLLLLGDGILRPQIEQKIAQLGLKEKVILAGVRDDIPRLMLGAIDVFVLPSFHEGLPVVGIEAQAAGLPSILSDTITKEVDKIPTLIQYLSLSRSPADWAEAILAKRDRKLVGDRQKEALISLENSIFNIDFSVKKLENIYLNAQF
jgi:glycosyltransferase involved in cell wall biosynthesis